MRGCIWILPTRPCCWSLELQTTIRCLQPICNMVVSRNKGNQKDSINPTYGYPQEGLMILGNPHFTLIRLSPEPPEDGTRTVGRHARAAGCDLVRLVDKEASLLQLFVLQRQPTTITITATTTHTTKYYYYCCYYYLLLLLPPL